MKLRCNCGWEGGDDDLRTECVFHATHEEPAEYEAYCPSCGTNADDMEEVPLCVGCDDVYVENEGNACAACEEVFRAECGRP